MGKTKVELNIGFAPSWFYENYGIAHGEKYCKDIEYRIAINMEKSRILYDRFGFLGLGSKDPKPEYSAGIYVGFIHSQLFGAKEKYRDDMDMHIEPMNLDEDACWKLKPIENIAEAPVVKDVLMNQVKYLESKYNWKWTSSGDWHSIGGVLNVALDIRGNQILEDVIVRKDLAKHIFYVISETLVKYADFECKMWGHRPRYSAISNCSGCNISPIAYRDMLFACDEWISAKYDGLSIHHEGGRIDNYIEIYSRHPKIVAIDVSFDSDVEMIRRYLPAEQVHVNLYLHPIFIKESKPDVIINTLKSIIAKSGIGITKSIITNDGTLVPQTGVFCSYIESGTPDENVAALYEVCS